VNRRELGLELGIIGFGLELGLGASSFSNTTYTEKSGLARETKVRVLRCKAVT